MAFSPETYALLAGKGGGGGGGDSSVFVIHATYDEDTYTVTLDKTWNEIYSAITGDKMCVVFPPKAEEPDYTFAGYEFAHNCGWEEGSGYTVLVGLGYGEKEYTAASGDDYPSYLED